MAIPSGDERIEIIEDTIDAAGYYLRDWVERAEINTEKQTYKLFVYAPEEYYETAGLERTYTLSYDQIWGGLRKIATGEYGTVRRDIKAACREAYFDGETGEVDAEVASCVVQVAALGEVIFG